MMTMRRFCTVPWSWRAMSLRTDSCMAMMRWRDCCIAFALARAAACSMRDSSRRFCSVISESSPSAYFLPSFMYVPRERS